MSCCGDVVECKGISLTHLLPPHEYSVFTPGFSPYGPVRSILVFEHGRLLSEITPAQRLVLHYDKELQHAACQAFDFDRMVFLDRFLALMPFLLALSLL